MTIILKNNSVCMKIVSLISIALITTLLFAVTYLSYRNATKTAFDLRESIGVSQKSFDDISLKLAILHGIEQRFLIERSTVTADEFDKTQGRLTTALSQLKSTGVIGDGGFSVKLSAAFKDYVDAVSSP